MAELSPPGSEEPVPAPAPAPPGSSSCFPSARRRMTSKSPGTRVATRDDVLAPPYYRFEPHETRDERSRRKDNLHSCQRCKSAYTRLMRRSLTPCQNRGATATHRCQSRWRRKVANVGGRSREYVAHRNAPRARWLHGKPRRRSRRSVLSKPRRRARHPGVSRTRAGI